MNTSFRHLEGYQAIQMKNSTLCSGKRITTGPVVFTRIAFFLIFIGLFAPPGISQGRETITMYLGEVKVMDSAPVERIAIGNPKVASNSILPQGQLVLLGDSAGATTMHIWMKDGSEKDFDVIVVEKKVMDVYQELATLLKDVPGARAEKVGEMIVVKGKILKQDKSHFDRIMERYRDVLNLVTTRDTNSEIAQLLENIPGLTVREVGGNTVISGEISSEYENLVKTVEEKYSGAINMTRIHEAVAGKMVYMKVRIMEMNRSYTEKLGIKWNVAGILGPSFSFGVENAYRGSTILNQKGTPQVLKKSGNAKLSTASGYFGIATEITSLLDLSESTGDAVVLAEPQLSARSGGKAEFLAGGEYPVPSTSTLGASNVEFKKYGISLNVEPLVDDRNNILAHVETEISTIDKGNAVNNIPGVLSRRTSTDVSLRANETLVIAGLVQDLANNDFDKVKWLGDIPLLGNLFKSKDFQNQKTELVIFITPTIYDASSPLNSDEIAKGEKIRHRFAEITGGNGLLE